MQVGLGAGVEGGGQFQRQVFRQHDQVRAAPFRLAQQGLLLRREFAEIAGCADRVLRHRDFHVAASKGRIQKVSGCSMSPTPTSFQCRRMVMPGWRT